MGITVNHSDLKLTWYANSCQPGIEDVKKLREKNFPLYIFQAYKVIRCEI